jgi:hypothetical protein
MATSTLSEMTCPRQAKNVGKETLGQTVTAHSSLGDRLASFGEVDRSIVCCDDAVAFESLDHLGDGRARNVKAFGDPSLDDVDVILA